MYTNGKSEDQCAAKKWKTFVATRDDNIYHVR
jgi:hypothetical protein